MNNNNGKNRKLTAHKVVENRIQNGGRVAHEARYKFPKGDNGQVGLVGRLNVKGGGDVVQVHGHIADCENEHHENKHLN